jgi:Ferritin-like domain
MNLETNRTTQDGASAIAVAVVGGLIAATALPAQTRPPTDLEILNYALTLEHLEAAFYNQGLRQYSSSDFAQAPFFAKLGEVTANEVYSYLSLIRSHENTHVRSLVAALRSFGATPVSACTYNFSYSSVEDFLRVAQTLENTGVMAYTGVIGMINSPSIRTTAATIATVEARHASYLNVLNNGLAAPAAFDVPKTMVEILAAAAPFFKSCPAA